MKHTFNYTIHFYYIKLPIVFYIFNVNQIIIIMFDILLK